MNVLRNRAFGHRSRAHTGQELFKQLQMRPDDLKNLIALTKKLLNTLSQAAQRETYVFDADAARDTVRLLDDLTSLHKDKS